MSAAGIRMFDDRLQSTDVRPKRLLEGARAGDRREAYATLRAVLHAPRVPARAPRPS